MSASDSETSSSHGEYKMFRQVTRDRLLYEMIKAAHSKESRSMWKVLIMDRCTMKVISHSCKMADITDQGVSLVEQAFRRRQPMPSMDAVYFVQPTDDNLGHFMADMTGRTPMYKKAFVFFSSPIPKDFIDRIKADPTVPPRIGGLSEMNLEYFPIENQAFVTDHERALEELYGDDADTTPEFDVCLREMAIRVATVFASLKEFPTIRYRVKPTDGSVESTFRELVPKKLALAIWEYIKSYQTTIPNFPQSETCELLILDRSVDLVAPIIHEWTYDAMCHDLIDLDGNKYTMEVPNKSGGQPERKDFLLEDHDPIWLEMRHLHIADASEKLSDKMDTLMTKNKAAQLQQKDKSEMSTRDIQQMVQAMPAFNEQKERLSLHVEIAGKINKAIAQEGLRDLGQIEQDLVFGDAGNKELLEFLEEYEDDNIENRLRLMMIYALADPEKFEGENGAKLMELADLSPQSMIFINNMRLLEGPPKPKKPEPSGGFLKGKKKGNAPLRKDKQGEEETWALFRFFPVLEELLEKIDKNEMPKDEYECINDSTPSGRPGPPSGGPGRGGGQRRSRRTAGQTKGDDGHASEPANAPVDLKHLGQRIFVFIIGGATRSELRVCHKLTAKLKREVVLGSTSIDDPPNYITKVKMLSFSGYGC
ncbi:hypothetical protein L1887_37141 [Cichorium endivia]|nr:hypothetical protein L1887_37141 [Cichorium endivia]